MELKQDGSTFSGSITSSVGSGTIEEGKLSGDTFTGVMKVSINGQSVDFTMEGKLDGNKLSGTVSNPGFGNIPFSGTKN